MGNCDSVSEKIETKVSNSHVHDLTPITAEEKKAILLHRQNHLTRAEIARQQKNASDLAAAEIDLIQNRNSRIEKARIFAAECFKFVKPLLSEHEFICLIRVQFHYVKPLRPLHLRCLALKFDDRYYHFNIDCYEECMKDPVVYESWKVCIQDLGIFVRRRKGDARSWFVFVLDEQDFDRIKDKEMYE